MIGLVHHVWLGGEMPVRYQTWRSHAMALNPGVKFKLWTEENIKELGLDLESLKRRFPFWAGGSNVVRLYAVYQYGGLYMDLDFIHHKPLGALLEADHAWACPQKDGRICNAVFYASPGHPWVKWQIDRLGTIESLAPYSGVDLMSHAPGDDLRRLDPHLFYPYMWDTPVADRLIREETIAEHTWAGSWLA